MSGAAFQEIKQLLATPEPPELGPGPRADVQSQSELNAAFDGMFRGAKLSSANQQLIRALTLLWHDQLDAAHVISQDIENPDGSFVHALVHRREPDYSNSKYWWRRVGKHPCFAEVGKRVAALLESNGNRDLLAKVVPRGNWDPFAFVDACEAAAGLPASDERVRLLRAIQQIETEVALEHFLEGEGN